MPDGDKTYLAQMVSAKTGISQEDARKRADDMVAQAQAWVRGGEADGRNFANISMVYAGQILGVCLTHGSCRRRLLDRENPLRH